jgi:hypothetical protein
VRRFQCGRMRVQGGHQAREAANARILMKCILLLIMASWGYEPRGGRERGIRASASSPPPTKKYSRSRKHSRLVASATWQARNRLEVCAAQKAIGTRMCTNHGPMQPRLLRGSKFPSYLLAIHACPWLRQLKARFTLRNSRQLSLVSTFRSLKTRSTSQKLMPISLKNKDKLTLMSYIRPCRSASRTPYNDSTLLASTSVAAHATIFFKRASFLGNSHGPVSRRHQGSCWFERKPR